LCFFKHCYKKAPLLGGLFFIPHFLAYLKSFTYICLKLIDMPKNFPKLLVLGAARHGKDTFAEILRDNFGLKFQSSSQAAADIFLYDELKDKYGYQTPEECFEDRMNHRQEWYEAICEYNKNDRTRLAKDILKLADCYVGMRDRDEIEVCMKQGLFDLIIWVDASDRLEGEGVSSFNIDISCADVVVYNNGTLDELFDKTIRLGKILFKMEPKEPKYLGAFIINSHTFPR
jgi:dephospho-CoA kinase